MFMKNLNSIKMHRTGRRTSENTQMMGERREKKEGRQTPFYGGSWLLALKEEARRAIHT